MTPMKRMEKAVTALVLQQPFFGTLALYLVLVVTTQFPTLATDGISLLFNINYLAKLGELELIGCIAHEVMHLALRHHTRRGQRDHELWNKAADYEINPILISAGFKLPKGALLDHRFNGMNAELIYEILKNEQQLQQQQQQQQQSAQGDGEEEATGDNPNDEEGADQETAQSDDEGLAEPTPDGEDQTEPQGSSEGKDSGKTRNLTLPAAGQESEGTGSEPAQSCGDPGMCGEVLDASCSPAELGEQDAIWEARVRQAYNVSKAGNDTGNISGIVSELNKPHVDWREEVREWIDDPIVTDVSWKEPNRRLLSQGFILPGSVSDGIDTLGIGCDTSGSIYCNPRALDMFQAELQSLMDGGFIRRIVVAHVDSSYKGKQEFYLGDKVELLPIGGGGTAFAPAFAWFTENEPDIQSIIYLTDLESTDFGPEPTQRILWARYGGRGETPPFGRIVDLKEDN